MPHNLCLRLTSAKLLVGLLLFAPLALLQPLYAQQAPNSSRWEKDIQALEASDKTNPPPKGAILFIGSSSIRMWKSLSKDFPDHKVINRGFGGSEIKDSVAFADRVVFPYEPKRIVMYAGGNDISGRKTPEQVAGDFKAFVEKVHSRLPETRISYISISPNPARWAQRDRIEKANQLIEEYTLQNPKLSFINLYPRMLGEDGLPKPDIFLADRLHMNARGYELWASYIRPLLASEIAK